MLPVPADPTSVDGDIAEQVAHLTEQAAAWLREANELEAVSEVRARASALAAYIRQRKAGVQAEFDAGALVRRAERREGQLLAEQKKAGQRKGIGRPAKESGPLDPIYPTLAEQGITQPQMKAATLMAKGTDEQFEQALTKVAKPTRGAVAREITPDPVGDAEQEASVAGIRLRKEVHALAAVVGKLANMGDAPSSLALLLSSTEVVAGNMGGIIIDAWLSEAQAAQQVLTRWLEQIARAKGDTT